MRKNPRKPKTQKIVEEKVTSDSETSENSNSDDPKIPENKATEYEKQRELRIAQNKARIEDLGLRNIANSLMNLSQKGGKRKSNLNSKRVSKNGKDDDEYQPIDEEDPKDDSSDSSERALRYIAGLKADCWKLRRSHVIYPEFCEEVIEGLPFPEGFNGFNLEESKEICGVIVALINAQSRLKKLFQSYVQGSKSFPCLQYQPSTQVFCPQHQASTQVPCHRHQAATQVPCHRHQAATQVPCHQHQASTQVPCHQHQAATQVPCPQHQAATPVTGHVQFNAPIYPDHGLFFPYWCPPMTPFGMAPTTWNPYNANYAPPYMGNYSGMP
uniref:Uncharacterized protein n=1 Tax=Chenopodium quinoa TaxID=63459 RepID=A0A803KYQ8_CHEQI